MYFGEQFQILFTQFSFSEKKIVYRFALKYCSNLSRSGVLRTWVSSGLPVVGAGGAVDVCEKEALFVFGRYWG
jgi:hypothetical protein